MNARRHWLRIAQLRLAEGDNEGAARARRNANAYVGRRYRDSTSPTIVWSDAARRKYGVPV